ncbi:MAG: hypothetical protein CSB24_01720 [Deltaproteobacteria bacterium]|nr:MAG: hypothetical protein CSB24_01720 [Deltaproteobacteria bacterium]
MKIWALSLTFFLLYVTWLICFSFFLFSEARRRAGRLRHLLRGCISEAYPLGGAFESGLCPLFFMPGQF